MASVTNGELVLINAIIDGKIYFEVSLGESRTKARNNAAKKVIERSDLLEWMKVNHSEEMI